MAKKEKLEKDFEDFNKTIENAAENEIKKIEEQAKKLILEAQKSGESIEISVDGTKSNVGKKKG